MAKLREGVTFAVYGADLKTYLGITGTAEDALLEPWLLAACSAGDSYMKNAFEGSPDTTPYPPEVLTGCYEWVRVVRSYYQAGAIDGTGSVKTGDLTESFGGAGLQTDKAARAAAQKFWYPYACRVWH